MLNEAPKSDLKQKVAKTNKRGQTLKNFRLSQKDSQDAQDRAKRAQAQAPAGGAVKTVKTEPSAPYSAQNYKATMAKRNAAQKKAAASAAKKTKAVPTGKMYTPQKDDGIIKKAAKKVGQFAKDKAIAGVKKVGQAINPLHNTKKKLKRTGLAGLGAASLAVPVLALHMGEGRKMRTLRDVREAKMVTGNETGMMFKVSIEGLPDMIMIGKSPGEIKGQLRKIVKQPSMIQSVERMPKSKVKMMYRDIVAGRDEDE